MATYDNSYSRLVAWLKIVLPLIALAILSTLFLVSRTLDPGQTIPYASVDIDELAREERITEPNYSGMTSDGSAISFSAESARPDPEDEKRLTANLLTAEIETPDGATLLITAANGVLDGGVRRAALGGGVHIETSTGYDMETETLISALDVTHAESDGEVRAVGPIGNLTAGRMLLTHEADQGGAYVLVFKDGVDLIYDPKP